MDGNGRWAAGRGKPRSFGHAGGVDAVRRTVRASIEFGIEYLTLFGFSSENWRRPANEVNYLMGLIRRFIASELEVLDQAGVQLRMIGNRTRLEHDLVEMIEDAEQRTARHDRLCLTVALSYGGREDIATAARRLVSQVSSGQRPISAIDEQSFAAELETSYLPDPDLLIRTGGEKRISNFLLWQSAYAELVFLDRLWPDFDKDDLSKAIAEFASRSADLSLDNDTTEVSVS